MKNKRQLMVVFFLNRHFFKFYCRFILCILKWIILDIRNGVNFKKKKKKKIEFNHCFNVFSSFISLTFLLYEFESVALYSVLFIKLVNIVAHGKCSS